MAGKFELYRDSAGKYRFRLKASNGQVIATSQGYVSRKSALDGIEAVRKHAAQALIVELQDDPVGL